MTFTPGIFPMPEAEYHALPYISKSGLDLIARSPAHYMANKNEKREPTPAMELGTAIHSAILEPRLFYDRYICRPEGIDGRTSEGKVRLKDLMATGKNLIPYQDFKMIEDIITSINSTDEAYKYLMNGKTEHSIFWIDEETGVQCKARPDYLTNSGIIVDVKTTENASFSAFQRSIAKYRYHVQAAFYMDGLAKALGKEQVGFVFIAVEKTPPYAVAVYYLDEASIDVGRALYRRDINKYAECLKNNAWPAYPNELQVINIPHWAFNEVESV